MSTPPRRLVSVNDAAALLAVNQRTIRRWISESRLTGYKVGDRLIRVDIREVERLARPIPAGEARP